MVISSLVVEILPGKLAQVADEIAGRPGVEVHERLAGVPGSRDANTSVDKAVVTIEADTVEKSQATANGFVTIDGVVGVDLVYANFEDDPAIAALRERHRQGQAPLQG